MFSNKYQKCLLPGQGITLHGLETERPEMKHIWFQIESFQTVKFFNPHKAL